MKRPIKLAPEVCTVQVAFDQPLRWLKVGVSWYVRKHNHAVTRGRLFRSCNPGYSAIREYIEAALLSVLVK